MTAAGQAAQQRCPQSGKVLQTPESLLVLKPELRDLHTASPTESHVSLPEKNKLEYAATAYEGFAGKTCGGNPEGNCHLIIHYSTLGAYAVDENDTALVVAQYGSWKQLHNTWKLTHGHELGREWPPPHRPLSQAPHPPLAPVASWRPLPQPRPCMLQSIAGSSFFTATGIVLSVFFSL